MNLLKKKDSNLEVPVYPPIGSQYKLIESDLEKVEIGNKKNCKQPYSTNTYELWTNHPLKLMVSKPIETSIVAYALREAS